MARWLARLRAIGPQLSCPLVRYAVRITMLEAHHARHHPHHPAYPAADRRCAAVGLQPRLGIWPVGRSGPDPDHSADHALDGPDLGASLFREAPRGGSE